MTIGRLLLFPYRYWVELRMVAEEEAFYGEAVDVCSECCHSDQERNAPAPALWCCLGFGLAIALRAALIHQGF